MLNLPFVPLLLNMIVVSILLYHVFKKNRLVTSYNIMGNSYIGFSSYFVEQYKEKRFFASILFLFSYIFVFKLFNFLIEFCYDLHVLFCHHIVFTNFF